MEGDRLRNNGPWSSETGDTFGMFAHLMKTGVTLVIMATDGDPNTSDTGDWEHVSVHARQPKLDGTVVQRTPTWDEMCHVKDLFWTDDEQVIQYHPAKFEYVNRHDHVLHLWRPIKADIPKPPTLCV